MTDREKEIFDLIESNPMIAQSEIASQLNIARTSVAVHISNLIKKGYIAGKGYITNIEHPVTVIGGANVDIQGSPNKELVMYDSNPGLISTSLGGVGRNIAENMSLLGLDVRMISAIGEDKEGHLIRDNARDRGINIEDCLFTNSHRTSTYMYIQNAGGEMIAAISDMEIANLLNERFLEKKLRKVNNSPYTIIDANLSESVIEFLTQQLNKTKLILDPVSTTKAQRVRNSLSKFYAVKLNKIEAEILYGHKLTSKKEIIKAGQYFVDLGINRVFITLGSKGVYYHDEAQHFFRTPFKCEVINVTGAGDAFTAAIVKGLACAMEAEALVDYCIGASTIALTSNETISTQVSHETILSLIKENRE